MMKIFKVALQATRNRISIKETYNRAERFEKVAKSSSMNKNCSNFFY